MRQDTYVQNQLLNNNMSRNTSYNIFRLAKTAIPTSSVQKLTFKFKHFSNFLMGFPLL